MIFVNSQPLGEAPIYPEKQHSDAEQFVLRTGLVYICPQTGKPWATLPVVDGAWMAPFTAINVPGPGSRSRSGYPAGSLLNAHSGLLKQLTPQALVREFHLHLNHYESEL